MMWWKRISVPAVTLVACLAGLNVAVDFIVDWAWFAELGYRDVFWTAFATKALLFLTAFAATAILVWFNGWIACEVSKTTTGRSLTHPGHTGYAPQAARVPD